MRAIATAILTALMLAAAGTAAAQQPVTVDLARNGTIVSGGHAALLRVTVTCERGHGEVLEAFVLLEQGTTSGQGGIGGIVCDGTPRTSTVRVSAFNGTYRPGHARGDAFVLVCDDAGNCSQGEDIEQVVLRRGH